MASEENDGEPRRIAQGIAVMMYREGDPLDKPSRKKTTGLVLTMQDDDVVKLKRKIG